MDKVDVSNREKHITFLGMVKTNSLKAAKAGKR